MNWKPIAVFVVATAVGFMLESPTPVGSKLWPMDSSMPDPEGSNLVLLMLMGGIEAVAFGLGVCFLVYGMPWVRRITTGAGTSAPLLYVSVAWLLVNWVPHTALHMMVGNITKPSDFTGLVAIEYGFHLTLILAGACIMYCLMRFNRGATPTATGASAKPRAA